MSLKQSILNKLDVNGPIDMYVSEEEYEDFLRPEVKRRWQDSDWMSNDYLYLLAFFRGYTFYKDVSEDEHAFWRSFHQEINIDQPVPTGWQYDRIEESLSKHESTANRLEKSAHGDRQFVKAINDIWSITSFTKEEIVEAFILYYQNFPGKKVTAEIMLKLLPLRTAHQQQVSNYHRVFKTMTRLVDYILDYDLDVSDVEALEQTLVNANLDLGQPNAIRYFNNKSSSALSMIVKALRIQRSPEQFLKYLKTIPKHTLKQPNQLSIRAKEVSSANIFYGEYYDFDTQTTHQVVPAARISLILLKELPKHAFRNVAGLSIYLKPSEFTITKQGQTTQATAIYFGSQRNYLWVGKAIKGQALFVDDKPHPKAIGATATITNLVQQDSQLERLDTKNLKIDLNCFYPELETITVNFNEQVRSVPAQASSSHSFQLSNTDLNVKIQKQLIARWQQKEGIYLADIDITGQTIYSQQKKFTIIGKDLKFEGSAKCTTHNPRKHELTWLNDESLVIHSHPKPTTIKPSQHQITFQALAKKINSNLTVLPHKELFTNHPYKLKLIPELNDSETLEINQKTINLNQKTSFSSSFTPIIKTQGSLEILETQTPQEIRWEAPEKNWYLNNHIYAMGVTLTDGRFKRFRFKPHNTTTTEPEAIHQTLELSKELEFDVSIFCRAVYLELKQADETLTSLTNQTWNYVTFDLKNTTNDFKLRGFLASNPDQKVDIKDYYLLNPKHQDSLMVELCVDKRSESWALIKEIPVIMKPELLNVQALESGFSFQTNACSNARLRLEEYNPKTGKPQNQVFNLKANKHYTIKLKHISKFTSLHSRLYLSSETHKKEQFVTERIFKPQTLAQLTNYGVALN